MHQAYLSALPSAVIAVDASLSVLFFNPAAEMLLGISEQQALAKPLSALAGMDEEVCALCQRALASAEALSLFGQTLRIPLNHRVVNLHLTPVEGQLLLSIEKSDGLDQQAASEWKQEATRAAGVMAAMMAHEVKNPLSGIRGAAQLLKEEVAPEHEGLAELICLEADRIRDLLNQIEVFTGGPVESPQPINIHEVLQYVISIAQSGFAPHVTFRERYDPSLPMVLGQRDLLVQLFLNLLKNAAEALAGQQEQVITLTTSYRSGYRVRLGHGEMVALPVAVTVEDNGPGVPQPVRARLFEPFVSSKDEGRGLGLAVVARIASDLGAVVELDQEFDGGARFCVRLACE